MHGTQKLRLTLSLSVVSLHVAATAWAAENTNQLRQGAYYTESEAREKLATFAASYDNLPEWQKRAAEIKHGILKGSGLDPLPSQTPLHPIFGDERQHEEGFTVTNVAFESLPGFFVTGNLYRPLNPAPGAKHPGILVAHGHGATTGVRFDESYQTFCQMMARIGAVVLVYDMVGYGESTQFEHQTDITLGLQLWNSMRAVDFMTSLAEVDPMRIGITGQSGGGTQTILLAATDDRVAASAPVTMVSAHFFGGCACESGMPIHCQADYETNNAEIAALAAPRPLLIVSVGNDWTKNTPQVEFRYIRGVYALFGQRPNAKNYHFPEQQHDFGPSKRAAVYAFFADEFALDTSPIKNTSGLFRENAVVIEPRETMLVFDDAHPRPEYALKGADAVRAAFAKR